MLFQTKKENGSAFVFPGLIGQLLNYVKKTLILRGIIFLILGILMMFHPADVLMLIAILVGISILIDGCVNLFAAWRYNNPQRPLAVFGAVCFILLGIATITSPLMVNTFWVVMIGFWELFSGIQCLCLTNNNTRGTALVSGILSIIVGILLISSPLIGLLTISWLIGVMSFISGLSAIILGIRLKSAIEQQ